MGELRQATVPILPQLRRDPSKGRHTRCEPTNGGLEGTAGNRKARGEAVRRGAGMVT